MADDHPKPKKKKGKKKKKTGRREQTESGRMAKADESNEGVTAVVTEESNAAVAVDIAEESNAFVSTGDSEDAYIVVEQDDEVAALDPMVAAEDGDVEAAVATAEDIYPAPIGEPEASEFNAEGGFTEDGLAVATAIDTTGEDEFVYAAIEYDPDSKPPLFRNRRFLAYSCLALTIIGAVVALSVVYTTKSTKKANMVNVEVMMTDRPTTSPTSAPTSDREASGIIEQLEVAVLQRNASFDNMTDYDPRKMALDWILHKDLMQLLSNDENLYQRYVLALLAYSWDSEAWNFCGDHKNYTKEKCTVTYAGGNEEEENIVWLSSTDECDWYGVICSDGVVRGLELIDNSLIGEIPPEISKLDLIQYIALNANCLHGPIPPEFGNMDYLQSLELHGNGLSGVLPDQFYDASKLQLINLSINGRYIFECKRSNGNYVNNFYEMGDSSEYNNGIQGKLDNKIAKFRYLKGLHIFQNQFSGDLAPEIGNLKFLVFLRAQDNVISGEIPKEITKLKKLREIRLNDNYFYSRLPTDIGGNEDLEALEVNGNEMYGPIPDSLYDITGLKSLNLADTVSCDRFGEDCVKSMEKGFDGSIKTEIGQLKKLTRLLLNNNPFTGTLPTELGYCEKLSAIRVHKTLIDGSIPEEVCMLRDKELTANFYADCRPNNRTREPFLKCNCCTDCCDHTTEICVQDD